VYASAADSQEKVKQARGIIFNTVIGLVLFIALYALVNFIVPGGVL
jgi:tetrahydromethanopterin S-methyltransferase subunit G